MPADDTRVRRAHSDTHDMGQHLGVKQRNTGMILRYLLLNPGQSRTEVAQAVGLSAPTVTNISSQLIAQGFVKGLDAKTGSMGRPRVPLTIDPDVLSVLGIHLGPKVTGLTVMGLDGSEKHSVLVPHDDLDGPAALAKIIAAATNLLETSTRPGEILGTGVATGGIVDQERGIVIDQPSAGWKNLDVMTPLREALPGPVVFEHNAKSAAQWELLYGVGRETQDFLMLVVASDVACISVAQGQIRRGAYQSAGQIAHLTVPGSTRQCECGRTGCFRASVSDESVVEQAVEAGMTGLDFFDRLVQLANSGSAQAQALLSERNRAIARVSGLLIDFIDPDRLVIAGSPAEVPAHIDEIRDFVRRESTAGPLAADRIVASDGKLMVLTIYAASVMVAKILDDPLSFVDRASTGNLANSRGA